MADNINYNAQTGRHSFVSVKERPWHGLGQIVQEKMTASECIQLAGLDYQVIKAPMYVDTKHGQGLLRIEDLGDESTVSSAKIKERFKISGKAFSTIRTDNAQVLGVVGSDYTVIDNNQAFEFFDTIVGTQAAIYETAGALGRGEVIFITAKIPNIINIGSEGRDNVERYIVLSNSHDGSKSLEAFITTIRVVCNNTLAAARNSAACRFKIRHTKNAKDRIHAAQDILSLEQGIIEAFAVNANTMAMTSITDGTAMGLIAEGFLTSGEKQEINAFNMASDEPVHLERFVSTRKLNLVNDVFNHYKNGPGSELITAKDKVWGVYNAVSSYYQNGKKYGSDSEKMKSLFYGDAYNKITKAYNVAADFAMG